ncbi:MAG: hypothetical protein IJ220_05170 [Clostridia bacterium]|nr:hypothetical protein [Clostridia bacterium]
MKRLVCILSVGVLLVLSIFVLTACGNKNNNTSEFSTTNDLKNVSSIVGDWKNDTYLPGYTFIYTFNENGTGKYDTAGTIMPFKYVVNGNKLSILYDGNDVPFETEFEINGNTLNVKDSAGKDTLYERIDASQISKATTNDELTNEEMYGGIIENYQKALAEFDLENLDTEKNIEEKYSIKDTTLLAHIARYSGEGVQLTYSFYDVDKNGVDELLLGASGSIGAIYTFDKQANQPVSLFFQSTLERGDLSIYDNGVILSAGAGGAALHYYEFGKIADDGISYELLESIEEEYTENGETPTYSDAKTGEALEYKSLDEINNKYIFNANKI